MMIAAAHLRRHDIPASPLTPSDEPNFDSTYVRRSVIPGGDQIWRNSARTIDGETRRLITFFCGSYRVWDPTTLIEVEVRA